MKIQWGDPIVVATIRGLYTAVGMGAFMWLTVYSTTDDAGAAWVAFGFAFLGALGFRAGVEGVIDQQRAGKMGVPERWVEPPEGFDEAIVGAQRFDAGIPVMSPPPAGWSVTDFDSDYHFTDDGRHLGKSVDCKLCNP